MVNVSKIYRILITALLSLLGFSCGSCGVAAEYGVPSATYKAKGVVVSESDDSPIEGIRTVLRYSGNWEIADAYTNSEGYFSLEGFEVPGLKLYVELIDVDGEENGLFAGMEVEADYTNATFTGGSGWYEGEAEIDLGKIKMKPENKDNP
jgi:putative lipoprotein (rSAM/lipoprotein system)